MRALAKIILILLILGALGVYAVNRVITNADKDQVISTVFSWFWEQTTQESIDDSQNIVIDALHAYANAQQKHHAENGRYAKKLANLPGLPSGMADANVAAMQSDFHGYLFIAVEMNGTTRMDYSKEFVLVAFPAFYPASGTRSYAIGPKGIVIEKDQHWTPVMNATELASWRPIKL